ncbi:hypothetical protein [Piscinibacter sp. HJYY11]|uniref:hypothetical protein n=1 Tax=Piscinibacter sp. HJYY11 TaxID=2801333 RepID=UPI00191E9D30|nr:hypothetical protein [Piscinibacter sp. HJYY11]MBL0726172.1 hypothetical protein [Piscinibacter sp. HJYY11]
MAAAPMSPARKRIAMLVVAVGSVLLVQKVVALSGDDTPEPELTRPTRERAPADAPRAPASASMARVQLDRLSQRAAPPASAARAAEHGGLFEIVGWAPPAPKTAPLPPPPKPTAPQFPYPYMGGLSEDGVRTAFFMKGERVLPVKAGDVVDAAYRIDEMNDQQMTLTYLPLNETMTVALEGGR